MQLAWQISFILVLGMAALITCLIFFTYTNVATYPLGIINSVIVCTQSSVCAGENDMHAYTGKGVSQNHNTKMQLTQKTQVSYSDIN